MRRPAGAGRCMEVVRSMHLSDVSVREEQEGDSSSVRAVHTEAFGGDLEAHLVDKLRASCGDRLSLVAVYADVIVGHILFTPASVQFRGQVISGWGLAPMAVRPGFQRKNIGTLLVEAGLAVLRERRGAFVVVLGHPQYYPRFGFQPASLWKLRSEWDVPNEVFMVLPLDKNALTGIEGVVRYRPEFHQGLET